MTDVHEPAVRSYNMSRIQGKNTKPELLVRRFLHANGFRFRLFVKDLPGRPDIVLRKFNTVIQVNGCFWHGHEGCRYFKIPSTRRDWWVEKISANQKRDVRNYKALEDLGWRVVTIWECELKKDKAEATLNDLRVRLLGS